MTLESLLAALDLPAAARVGQRVPKKMLVENGAPTAADKRIITEGIEELQWFAALKPATVGVPDYRDAERKYLEIAVLGLSLRPAARTNRLVELVHRAVPYPVVLLTHQADEYRLSLSHKRNALNEAGKTVLDGEPIGVVLNAPLKDSDQSSFLAAMAFARQPRGDLWALYQGWIDVLLARQTAALTGHFSLAGSPEHATRRCTDLRRYDQLANDIARLRNAAAKESQLARQVDLNLQIQRARAEQAALLKTL